MQRWIGLVMRRALEHAEEYARFMAGATRRPDPRAANPFAGMLPWDLNDSAMLEAPIADAKYSSELFDFTGIVLMRGAVDASMAAAGRDAANAHAAAIRRRVRDKTGRDPDEPHPGWRFHEAASRGPGRCDMRLHANDSHAAVGRLFDDTQWAEGAAWLPLVRRALGSDCRLLWRGLVVSEPGAPEQAVHADGVCSRSRWSELTGHSPPAVLPCHALTVFVPLVDVGRNNGATRFYPGTHQTLWSAPALEAEAGEAGSSGGAGVAAVLDASAGDAVVFDYRLFHAGGANVSSERRPLFYATYARKWYDDEHNFPGRSHSLWR